MCSRKTEKVNRSTKKEAMMRRPDVYWGGTYSKLMIAKKCETLETPGNADEETRKGVEAVFT